MSKLRITQALFDFNNKHNLNFKKVDIARLLFPHLGANTRNTYISRMEHVNKFINIDVVLNLCDILDTDPNTLMGYEKGKMNKTKKDKMIKNIQDIFESDQRVIGNLHKRSRTL